jgi:hypothetical protein
VGIEDQTVVEAVMVGTRRAGPGRQAVTICTPLELNSSLG